MVEIRPFKALMYDWDEVDGDAASVTAPPYDVLSPEDIARLKKKSLHNVTRLTLPDSIPGKGEDSKYAEAAKTLRRWLKEGVLAQTKDPAIYVYHETHGDAGARRTVRGFFALLRLDPDYREVLPHERTHKGPIEDRLKLLQATGMDLEPIQFLYDDPAHDVQGTLDAAVRDKEPAVAFTDPQGLEHKVWAVFDPALIEKVQRTFSGRKVYIADGHHRYATACHLAKLRREGPSGDPDGASPYDHKLSFFVALDDPAILVHPTHRMLLGVGDKAAARARLAASFPIEPIVVPGDTGARARELRRVCGAVDTERTHRFVFYWGDGEADVLTVGRDEVPQGGMGDLSAAWRALDVAVLHHAILPDTLGIDQSNAGERLRYTRIDTEAVAWADQGRYDGSIFMNPTPLAAVTAVADAGEHMPQKSTYFQPKALSGLLFSSLG